MSSNPGLEVLIKSILDSNGFKDLQANLQAAKTKLDETKDSAGGFGDAMSGLGGTVAAVTGVALTAAAGFALFKESLMAAVEDSRLMNQFAVANEVLGKATAESRDQNERWLASVENSTGQLKSSLIPSYLRLVAVTGEVSEAQRLTEIAANAAKAGLGEVGQVTQALIRYYETGKTGTRGFGAVLGALKGTTDDVSTGIKNVETKIAEMAAKTENAGTRTDAAKVGWTHLKLAVGDLATGAFTNLLAPALKVAAGLIEGLYAGFEFLVATVKTVITVVGALGNAFDNLITGHFKEAGKALTEIPKLAAKNWGVAMENIQAFGKKISDGLGKTVDDVNKKLGDFHPPKPIKDAIDLVAKLTDKYQRLLIQAQLTGKGQEDIDRKEIELLVAENKELGKLADADGKASMKILQNRKKIMDLEHKLTDEEVKEIAIRDRAREKSEAAELKGETDILKKKLALKEKWIASDKSKEQERLRAYLKELADELAAYTHTIEQEEALDKAYADARMKLDTLVAENKKMTTQDALQMGLGAASTIFGQNKVISVAQAIINTYEGFTKALTAPYPLDLIIPELVLVAGLAQVATIVSTNPSGGGGGFDNPSNDFASYVGGQRWARDMVDHFSAGAMAGFNSQVVNNDNKHVINNNQRNEKTTANYNIKLAGLIDSGNNQNMRRFVRTLQVVGKQEAARTPR